MPTKRPLPPPPPNRRGAGAGEVRRADGRLHSLHPAADRDLVARGGGDARRRARAPVGPNPRLLDMTSSSSFGISQITLQFDLGREIDGAAQDIQAAINAA